MKVIVGQLVILIVSFSSSVYGEDKCTQVDGMPPCVCAMPDGKRIDLRSLAHNDGTP